MKKSEIIKLMVIMTAAYPRFDNFSNPERAKPIIELWHEMLSDVPYPVAEIAVKKLILESPFPPTISDVRKQIVDITTEPQDRIDGSTAWGEVLNAIRIHGRYRQAEALESLSPRTRTVVKAMGWQELCDCEEPGVIRGQFLKMYEAYTTREKKDALMPRDMKSIVESIGTQFNNIGTGTDGLKLIKGQKGEIKLL